jgi:thiol-disulfide isomerase/thioredoxin
MTNRVLKYHLPASLFRLVIAIVVTLGSRGIRGAESAVQALAFAEQFEAPEFPKGLEWLNSRPLTKTELKGKFVLLDFWTYCCINCMHILPELKKLEQQYGNNLIVIGVHSGKFETEKIADNIREAIARYEIQHPVINDSDHELWSAFGVNVWPTVVLIDPAGRIVWRRSEEFRAPDVAKVIGAAMNLYRSQGVLNERPLRWALEESKEKDTPLRFPGKILADEPGNRLFISDSNHNRVVIATLQGELLDIVGHGAVGRTDGDYQKATFNHPQGCALAGEILYVADTENHLLRKVDLTKKTVVTIAGTGEHGVPANAFPAGTASHLRRRDRDGSGGRRGPSSAVRGRWRSIVTTCLSQWPDIIKSGDCRSTRRRSGPSPEMGWRMSLMDRDCRPVPSTRVLLSRSQVGLPATGLRSSWPILKGVPFVPSP